MKFTSGFFKGFKAGFQSFGNNIASAINFVALMIVYIFGVGITSVVAKLTGKKFLDIGIKNVPTYYITKSIKKEKIENYYRQF